MVLVNPIIITKSLYISAVNHCDGSLSTQDASQRHCIYACSRDVWHQGRNPRVLEHTLEDPSSIDWEVCLLCPLDSCPGAQ